MRGAVQAGRSREKGTTRRRHEKTNAWDDGVFSRRCKRRETTKKTEEGKRRSGIPRNERVEPECRSGEKRERPVSSWSGRRGRKPSILPKKCENLSLLEDRFEDVQHIQRREGQEMNDAAIPHEKGGKTGEFRRKKIGVVGDRKTFECGTMRATARVKFGFS